MPLSDLPLHLGKLLLNLVDHTEVVRDLTFAPDGSLILVSASRDKTLRVWDLKDDGMSVFLGCGKELVSGYYYWDVLQTLEVNSDMIIVSFSLPSPLAPFPCADQTKLKIWPEIGASSYSK